MNQENKNAEYDVVIAEHYRKVAEEEGLSENSTMADNITRTTETVAITKFVEACLKRRADNGDTAPVKIMDVGCGNGYTLEVLSKEFPGHEFVGVEKTDELRELAVSRFETESSVHVIPGDLRDEDFAKGHKADILICQRVLINLLDPNDQNSALGNVINTVDSEQGSLLFVECFESSLTRLNTARQEFDLDKISPAYHNLYLADDFFDVESVKAHELKPYGFDISENFLSTHFYITRVLHPMMTVGKAVKRNSEFVNFFSSALKPESGDYAPLKLVVLDRC